MTHLNNSLKIPVALSLLAVLGACQPDNANPQTSQTTQSQTTFDMGAPPGYRTLFVVAHQDDDFIFAYQRLASAIQSGQNVRTVYITAGDAGLGIDYAWGRNAGARAVYTEIAQTTTPWDFSYTYYGSHGASVARLGNNISHIYLNALDGFPNGSRAEGSLEQLWRETGVLPRLDGDVFETEADLRRTMAAIISQYQPDQIITLDASETRSQISPTDVGYILTANGVDHSDHVMTARILLDTLAEMQLPMPIVLYRGYSVSNAPPNIAEEVFSQKKHLMYDVYGGYDRNIIAGTYDDWLEHEYMSDFGYTPILGSYRVEGPCGRVAAGDAITPKTARLSCNGRYMLVHQGDGNLVLYDSQQRDAMWSTQTWNMPSTVMVMQNDGNLVQYTVDGPKWATGTQGYPGAFLAIQDDGNLVVYEADAKTPIWNSKTWRE